MGEEEYQYQETKTARDQQHIWNRELPPKNFEK
jgi:hypothetical protein